MDSGVHLEHISNRWGCTWDFSVRVFSLGGICKVPGRLDEKR